MAKKYTKRYEGRVVHNKDTLIHLFRSADSIYHIRKVLLRFGMGVILAMAGAMASFPIAIKAVLMMIGCWLVSSRDFPARLRAERTLENRKAVLPQMITTLYEDHISLSGEGKMDISYDKIRVLYKDKEYYYLFLGADSACMMEKKTLVPDKLEEFEAFLEKKTGLKWKEYKSFLQMNLTDIRELLSIGKQK